MSKKCPKCEALIRPNNFIRHTKNCNGEMSYHMKVSRGLLCVDGNIVCPFCKKLCKNPNSQRNHARLCKLNPERQISYIMKYHKGEVSIPPFKKLNQYTKAKILGLPKPNISEKTRQTLSLSTKNRTPEQRRKYAKTASKTIKEKVSRGEWHTSLAKRMHYNYKGNDLHGTWELKYAQWLDRNNITWKRCKTSFEYIFKNKILSYTPDFYLVDEDVFVEIKGYKTEKDEAKWSHFPKKLKVLLKQNLQELNIL